MMHTEEQPQNSNYNAYQKESMNTQNLRHPKIGGDRLQRAIERNKAKQAKRNKKNLLNAMPAKNQPSFFDKMSKPVTTRTRFSRKPEVLGKNNDIQFSSEFETNKIPDIKYNTKKPTSKLSTVTIKPNVLAKRNIRSKSRVPQIRTTQSTRSKSKKSSMSKKEQSIISKVLWFIVVVLFLQLTFAEGGISDYIKQDRYIDNLHNEIKIIEQENREIVQELLLIKRSRQYRKELVRKHLGFIASDEYVVLFSHNK